jgi:hypothetical protein
MGKLFKHPRTQLKCNSYPYSTNSLCDAIITLFIGSLVLESIWFSKWYVDWIEWSHYNVFNQQSIYLFKTMHISCYKATSFIQQLHYNYNNTAVFGIYSIMRCVYYFPHGHICRYLVLPLFYTRIDKVTPGPKGVGDNNKTIWGPTSVYTFGLL